MFKAVIATHNNTSGNIVDVVVCEDYAVEWVEKELTGKHPLATVLVSDVTAHWSAQIIRGTTPADLDGTENRW